MRTNQHFRNFLELDTQIPDTVCYSPIKVCELSELNLGGRDFIYLEEEGIMFVAMSDMNITSRIDAYLTNVIISNFLNIFSSTFHGKRRMAKQLNKTRTMSLLELWSFSKSQRTRMVSNLIECGQEVSHRRRIFLLGLKDLKPQLLDWIMERS